MTREQATAEAQRRNVADFRRTGALRTVWAEYEAAPGRWEVGLYEHGPRPLWRRAVTGLFEAALELNPRPKPLGRRGHTWRRNR